MHRIAHRSVPLRHLLRRIGVQPHELHGEFIQVRPRRKKHRAQHQLLPLAAQRHIIESRVRHAAVQREPLRSEVVVKRTLRTVLEIHTPRLRRPQCKFHPPHLLQASRRTERIIGGDDLALPVIHRRAR